jgi:hypothetical protein
VLAAIDQGSRAIRNANSVSGMACTATQLYLTSPLHVLGIACLPYVGHSHAVQHVYTLAVLCRGKSHPPLIALKLCWNGSLYSLQSESVGLCGAFGTFPGSCLERHYYV